MDEPLIRQFSTLLHALCPVFSALADIPLLPQPSRFTPHGLRNFYGSLYACPPKSRSYGDVGWTLCSAICHTQVGKNFSHKGKGSRKNGKWVHTSRGNLCQWVTNAVKSCQEKETAYSLLNKRYPIRPIRLRPSPIL